MRDGFINIGSGQDLSSPIGRLVKAKATRTTEVVDGLTQEADPTVVVSEIFNDDGGPRSA